MCRYVSLHTVIQYLCLPRYIVTMLMMKYIIAHLWCFWDREDLLEYTCPSVRPYVCSQQKFQPMEIHYKSLHHYVRAIKTYIFWMLLTPPTHWRSEMTKTMTNTHIHKFEVLEKLIILREAPLQLVPPFIGHCPKSNYTPPRTQMGTLGHFFQARFSHFYHFFSE